MGRKKKSQGDAPKIECEDAEIVPAFEQGVEQDEQKQKPKEKSADKQVPGKYRKFQGEMK